MTNSTNESYTSIGERINRTFTMLEKVAGGIVEGNIPAVIISGAAGCGKTYTLEHALNTAQEQELITYTTIRGAMSPIGLYRQLFEASEPGNVLVIDDCDSIFADIDSLNLLKAALDTSKVRKVHWNKESRVLDNEGIPRHFDFNGSVVFITNIDFQTEIERDVRMTPHFKALMSRCLYVDLGIHSKREILVRISQVMFGDRFLSSNNLSRPQAEEMLAWITRNVDRVRTLSIRTVLQLASLVKTTRDWQSMADAIMVKPR